jgi:hypothetical protein
LLPFHLKYQEIILDKNGAGKLGGDGDSPVAFFQMTTGMGTPSAWQCKVTCRLRSTLTSVGSVFHRGGTDRLNKRGLKNRSKISIKSWSFNGFFLISHHIETPMIPLQSIISM